MKVGAQNYSLAEAVVALCKHLEEVDPEALSAQFTPDQAAQHDVIEGKKPVTYRDLILTTLAEAGATVKTRKETIVIPEWELDDTD